MSLQFLLILILEYDDDDVALDLIFIAAKIVVDRVFVPRLSQRSHTVGLALEQSF